MSHNGPVGLSACGLFGLGENGVGHDAYCLDHEEIDDVARHQVVHHFRVSVGAGFAVRGEGREERREFGQARCDSRQSAEDDGGNGEGNTKFVYRITEDVTV